MNAELKDRMAATEGHAPWPWDVAGGLIIVTARSIDGTQIAIMAGPERMANANLIALAPELKDEVLRQDTLIGELVEGLRWTVNIMCGVSRNGGGVDPLEDEPEAAIENGKSILAKAKEQS